MILDDNAIIIYSSASKLFRTIAWRLFFSSALACAALDIIKTVEGRTIRDWVDALESLVYAKAGVKREKSMIMPRNKSRTLMVDIENDMGWAQRLY
jgi:hypothetical protein